MKRTFLWRLDLLVDAPWQHFLMSCMCGVESVVFIFMKMIVIRAQ